jgi:hypothetical protein
MRLAIRREARIGDFETLLREATRERDEAIRRADAERARAFGEAAEQARSGVAMAAQRRYDAIVDIAHIQYDDVGRYAAYLGYDAVRIPEFDYFLVLNRTAVRVQREDLR